MKEVTLSELMEDLASAPLGAQDLLGDMRHYVKGCSENRYVLRFDNGYGAVVYDEGTDYPLTAYWIKWDGEAKELTDYKVAYDGKGRSTYTAPSVFVLQMELVARSQMSSA